MWLELHECEPSTKRNYQHVLSAHIIPQFGQVRVVDLEREDIVHYLAELKYQGRSAGTQRRVRTTLSAMFQYALDNGYRQDFPVNRIKTQRVTRQQIPVLRPEEFAKVYRSLPSDGARTFANLVVSTGCRFGEATALLVSDVDLDRRNVTITKAVQDVGRKHHPDGRSRFYVAPYAKGHTHRAVRIGETTVDSLAAWIQRHELGEADLLFPKWLVCPPKLRARKVQIRLSAEVLTEIGTFMGANGNEYYHGTINGYVTGKCRCDYCRQAASDYRHALNQRRKGVRREEPEAYATVPFQGEERVTRLWEQARLWSNEEPYLDDGTWAKCWKQACMDAGLGFIPTAYQLRHTHASWLIRNGEDWRTVMTRLGHSDPSSTSLYVQSVDDDTSSALIMDSLTDW